MTSEPRQLYLPDGANAGESRRATTQLGDLRDGAGGRVGGGTAQGGRRDAVQRASGGTTARRGTGGVPRTTGVRAAAWGSAGRAWGSAGVHGRGAQRVGVGARRAGAGVGLGGVQGRGERGLGGAGSLSARGGGVAPAARGPAARAPAGGRGHRRAGWHRRRGHRRAPLARGAAAWRVGAGTGGRRAVARRGEGERGAAALADTLLPPCFTAVAATSELPTPWPPNSSALPILGSNGVGEQQLLLAMCSTPMQQLCTPPPMGAHPFFPSSSSSKQHPSLFSIAPGTQQLGSSPRMAPATSPPWVAYPARPSPPPQQQQLPWMAP
eukprot:XP_020397956.1 spidroin-1-like [Zea mays]